MLSSISAFLWTIKRRSQEELVVVVQEDYTCINLAAHMQRLLMVPSVAIPHKPMPRLFGDRDTLFFRLERCDYDH